MNRTVLGSVHGTVHRGVQFFALAMLALSLGCIHANPAHELTSMPAGTGFALRTSTGDAGSHKYSIFLPPNYTPTGRFPTIIFLHGIGESGSDGIGCTGVGLGPAIVKRNGQFPFVVIFPQTGWDWTSTESENIMLDALHDAEHNYPGIDTNRVSLTGMSSGGKGVWVLGARHPEIFACLVPMAGYSDDSDVPKLTHYPIWALHNSGDFIVGVGNSRDMYKRIKDAGGNIQYSEYSDIGHDCWDAAYDKGDLFTWMQQQTLQPQSSGGQVTPRQGS
jgi:predicted peptidase